MPDRSGTADDGFRALLPEHPEANTNIPNNHAADKQYGFRI
jgi:hypothetical protein